MRLADRRDGRQPIDVGIMRSIRTTSGSSSSRAQLLPRRPRPQANDSSVLQLEKPLSRDDDPVVIDYWTFSGGVLTVASIPARYHATKQEDRFILAELRSLAGPLGPNVASGYRPKRCGMMSTYRLTAVVIVL
jgi:hypothetical protein